MSRPAVGSSSSATPGSFISMRASSTRWRSPADSVGNGCAASAPQCHSCSSVERADAVGVVVPVPPGCERGVPRGHHDLGRGHRRFELGRERGGRERDAFAQGAHVGAAEALPEHVDRARRRVLVERRRCAAARSCPRRSRRARPSARRRCTVQSMRVEDRRAVEHEAHAGAPQDRLLFTALTFVESLAGRRGSGCACRRPGFVSRSIDGPRRYGRRRPAAIARSSSRASTACARSPR